MNKKMKFKGIFFLLAILILCFSLSVFAFNGEDENLEKRVPSDVKQVAHDNFEKVTKRVKEFLEEGEDTTLDISKFSLGEGYPISYIRNDILDCYDKLDSFDEFIEDSDEWLYIINYKDKSASYLMIANTDGHYEVVMFGGDAEYFDATIERYLENNSDKNNIRVLADANDYYLLNEEAELWKVPSHNLEYRTYRSVLAEPINGEVMSEVIKERSKKEVERRKNNGPILYGNFGLFKDYYKRSK